MVTIKTQQSLAFKEFLHHHITHYHPETIGPDHPLKLDTSQKFAWHLYAVYSAECAADQLRQKKKSWCCAFVTLTIGVTAATLQTLLWTIWK